MTFVLWLIGILTVILTALALYSGSGAHSGGQGDMVQASARAVFRLGAACMAALWLLLFALRPRP